MKSPVSPISFLLSSALFTFASADIDPSLPTAILPVSEAPQTSEPPVAEQTPAQPPPISIATTTSIGLEPTANPDRPIIESRVSSGFESAPPASDFVTAILPTSANNVPAIPTALVTDGAQNPVVTPAPSLPASAPAANAQSPVTSLLPGPNGAELTLVAIPTSVQDAAGIPQPTMIYYLNDVEIEPAAPLLVEGQTVQLNLPTSPAAPVPISSAGILFAPIAPVEPETPQANIVIGQATYAVPAAAPADPTELLIDTSPASTPAGQLGVAVPTLSTQVRATGTTTGSVVIQSTVNGGAAGDLKQRLSLAGLGMGVVGVGFVLWM